MTARLVARRRRRWPPQSPPWTLGRLMVVVAACAPGFGLLRLPLLMAVSTAVLFGLVLLPFLMARRGYQLVDIATVLAIALIAFCLLLPAMFRTYARTGGKRMIPVTLPLSLHPGWPSIR